MTAVAIVLVLVALLVAAALAGKLIRRRARPARLAGATHRAPQRMPAAPVPAQRRTGRHRAPDLLSDRQRGRL